MNTLDLLLNLKTVLNNQILPKAKGEWGGAYVAIRKNKPMKKQGFYPDPRYVITPFSHELSWLFNKLLRAVRTPR